MEKKIPLKLMDSVDVDFEGAKQPTPSIAQLWKNTVALM
jgi:hypothetical protein